MAIDTIKELERKPYSLETMRVRCPHCRKLYLVQFSDIKEPKPRFECVQCHSRFWLSLGGIDISSEIMGIPVHVKDPVKPAAGKTAGKARELEPCPKCFKPVPALTEECPACGVMIAKAKSLQFTEFLPSHPDSLAALWKKVLADYANESLHDEFLLACQREHCLPYAAAVYGQINKLMPGDEITGKRVLETQALAEMMVPYREKRGQSHRWLRVWQLPLMGSVILMVVGMAAPMFRNLVGVGAALLFLAVALRLQFRRR